MHNQTYLMQRSYALVTREARIGSTLDRDGDKPVKIVTPSDLRDLVKIKRRARGKWNKP